MLSKKRILSTCVLLATVMAGAEEGMIVKDGPKNFKTGPVRVDRFEKAIQSLAHEWRPFVKTLSRDLRSYHWATRKELNDISSFPLEGDVALDNEDTAQILKKHIGEFQKFTPKDKAAKLHLGGGLYAAVEPMQSKKWGGDNPALIDITLPAGSKFLDIRMPIPDKVVSVGDHDESPQEDHSGKQPGDQENSQLFMSPDTFKLFTKFCGSMNHSEMWFKDQKFVRIRKDSFTSHKSCHRAFQATLSKLEVNFIVYPWNYYRNEYCQEKENYQMPSSFYVTDVDFDSVKPLVYVDSLRPTASEEKKNSYAQMFDLLSYSSRDSLDFLTFFDERVLDLDFLEPWLENNIFGCNDNIEEDRTPAETISCNDIQNSRNLKSLAGLTVDEVVANLPFVIERSNSRTQGKVYKYNVRVSLGGDVDDFEVRFNEVEEVDELLASAQVVSTQQNGRVEFQVAGGRPKTVEGSNFVTEFVTSVLNDGESPCERNRSSITEEKAKKTKDSLEAERKKTQAEIDQLKQKLAKQIESDKIEREKVDAYIKGLKEGRN